MFLAEQHDTHTQDRSNSFKRGVKEHMGTSFQAMAGLNMQRADGDNCGCSRFESC